MKILLLHPPMYPVNHDFYNMLAKMCDLTVFQFGEHPRLHQGWTHENIRTDNIHYKLKIFGKGAISPINTSNPLFLFHLAKEKPDIVVSIAFWIPSIYTALLKNILNYKFIILTNMISATEEHHSFLRQKLRSFVASKTDAFIAASDLTKEYLYHTFNHPNIFLSIQTINVNRWRKDFTQVQEKEILLKKLNLPKNKKIMLGIGNYIEKKNWESVLKVLSEFKDIYFVIIGSGKHQKIYEEIIKKNNIEDNVALVGRKETNEILEYLKVSDFLIFPSYYDQFGFVVAEAMCVGVPVICTKNAGASVLIKHKKNGYLVSPKENFHSAIKYMMEHHQSMGEEAYKTMSHLTLEHRAEEFYKIFSEVNQLKTT